MRQTTELNAAIEALYTVFRGTNCATTPMRVLATIRSKGNVVYTLLNTQLRVPEFWRFIRETDS